MNDDLDGPVVQQARKALAEDLSAIDENTEKKLQAARFAALASYGRNKRLKVSRFPHALIPGLMFASSLCVAIGVWLVQPVGQAGMQISEEHVLIEGISAREISANEMEIVEELEFYEWLESSGYAG